MQSWTGRFYLAIKITNLTYCDISIKAGPIFRTGLPLQTLFRSRTLPGLFSNVRFIGVMVHGVLVSVNLDHFFDPSQFPVTFLTQGLWCNLSLAGSQPMLRPIYIKDGYLILLKLWNLIRLLKFWISISVINHSTEGVLLER